MEARDARGAAGIHYVAAGEHTVWSIGVEGVLIIRITTGIESGLHGDEFDGIDELMNRIQENYRLGISRNRFEERRNGLEMTSCLQKLRTKDLRSAYFKKGGM